eukprot:57350-Amphidinium_carterae.1
MRKKEQRHDQPSPALWAAKIKSMMLLLDARWVMMKLFLLEELPAEQKEGTNSVRTNIFNCPLEA